jgi:hypothetical protein
MNTTLDPYMFRLGDNHPCPDARRAEWPRATDALIEAVTSRTRTYRAAVIGARHASSWPGTSPRAAPAQSRPRATLSCSARKQKTGAVDDQPAPERHPRSDSSVPLRCSRRLTRIRQRYRTSPCPEIARLTDGRTQAAQSDKWTDHRLMSQNRKACSPAMCNASRLVARMRRPGQARSRPSASTAQAVPRCSQFSSSSSSVHLLPDRARIQLPMPE